MEYRLRAMELWFQHLPGSMLIEMETHYLSAWLSSISGEHLLQIGGPGDLQLVKSAYHLAHKTYLSTQFVTSSHSARIQSNLEELPIMPNSIDVVVLAHLLEFADSPLHLLQEIYHVLAPNGQVLILAFNPFSLWGLSRRSRKKRGFPWSGHFYPHWKIKRWLRKIGYSIITSKTLCYRPTVHDARQCNRLHFMETLGQSCFPGLGAVTFIAAQKNEIAVTPIKAKWWEKKVKVGSSYAEPSTRIKSS